MWTYSLVLITAGLAIWYIRLFNSYTRSWNALQSVPPGSMDQATVAVLIPFRNEENNLPDLLRALDRQDYSSVTWVLINDHSSDKGVEIIEHWEPATGQKVLIHLEQGQGKKEAIKLGIKSSNAEWILCTDADTVAHPNWVSTMMHCTLEKHVEFVSGPVAILPGKTWFGRWQALEFAGLIGIGAAAIQAGKPNMCNGANILYKKAAWERVGGFKGNEHMPGGDDQYLMHRIFAENAESVRFCYSPDAMVYTHPVLRPSAFLLQRIRWASKNGSYERKSVSLEMAGLWLFYFFILLCFMLALWQNQLFLWGLGFLLAKTWVEWKFYSRILPFFKGDYLKRMFILSEIIQLLYVVVTGILGKFGSYQWKGRKYNV